ncbi:50S ribosomal protein L6 [Blattabacterium cuenoti]|uniref:50S ribosomal protein L6 n=1 Tax=Blattabacterium cuenoti TaxID=1653831 RepID=UPI00163CBC6D|nr:50S ribosomal protein L6 [Blattabacterium cuenoti]
MSRIGKIPIIIPKNVDVEIVDKKIFVKGGLGTLKSDIIPNVLKINILDRKLFVIRNKEDKKSKSLHGLFRVLIHNMMVGVSKGFLKKLELIGIGYRVNVIENNILEMNLGFSHNIMIQLPKEIGVQIKSDKGRNFIIILKSHDKQLLGTVAYKIRSLRTPEPYKGKGVRYVGEEVRRKTGKSA